MGVGGQGKKKGEGEKQQCTHSSPLSNEASRTTHMSDKGNNKRPSNASSGKDKKRGGAIDFDAGSFNAKVRPLLNKIN